MWDASSLGEEIDSGYWVPEKMDKAMLMKARDKRGEGAGKPLWTDIMTKLGSKYKVTSDRLYNR